MRQSGTQPGINFMDEVCMAFDPIGVNVNGAQESSEFYVSVSIQVTGTSKTYTDTRKTSGKKVSFDLSAYVRALMVEDMRKPFNQTGGYFPTSKNFTFIVRKGTSVIFVNTFTAIWGSVNFNEKFNASRKVYLWDSYPNTVGAYIHEAYIGDDYYDDPGIVSITPISSFITVASDEYLIFRGVGEFGLEGLYKQYTLTFVNGCDFHNGIFLRWIGRDGLPISWLFKKGKTQRKITNTAIGKYRVMNGVLLPETLINSPVKQIESKQQSIIQDIGFPLADEEQYNILKGLLASPVVQAYIGSTWYDVSVVAKTDTRETSILQDFTAQIIMPEETFQTL